mgnify:CR=1 FL=1
MAPSRQLVDARLVESSVGRDRLDVRELDDTAEPGPLSPDSVVTVETTTVPDYAPALNGLQQLTTVEQIARERGVEPASVGYRSRAKVKEVV